MICVSLGSFQLVYKSFEFCFGLLNMHLVLCIVEAQSMTTFCTEHLLTVSIHVGSVTPDMWTLMNWRESTGRT